MSDPASGFFVGWELVSFFFSGSPGDLGQKNGVQEEHGGGHRDVGYELTPASPC